MLTKIRPKQSISQLIGNCAGKVDDRNIKLQCNWSKVLRFAPGMKFRPDELFEVFLYINFDVIIIFKIVVECTLLHVGGKINQKRNNYKIHLQF